MVLKFWLLKHCWWLIPVFFVMAVLFPAVLGVAGHFTQMLTWAAVLGATLFFIQKQFLAEKKLTVSVQDGYFKKFSELRPKLNAVLQNDLSMDLIPEQILHVFTYINLCSEAYWQYCNGLVAPLVWQSWVNKMRVFYYHPKIRHLWEKELKTESHYGFDIDIVR